MGEEPGNPEDHLKPTIGLILMILFQDFFQN